MSCLDDSDDHLRWVAPTDLNLDYMGITHLDCVTRVQEANWTFAEKALDGWYSICPTALVNADLLIIHDTFCLHLVLTSASSAFHLAKFDP